MVNTDNITILDTFVHVGNITCTRVFYGHTGMNYTSGRDSWLYLVLVSK